MAEITWNHICTWQYADLRCKNPVGQFQDGRTSGLCIFHRSTPTGHAAAQIAEESTIHDAESYTQASKRQTYGAGDNPAVISLRAQIAERPNAKTSGSFAGLQHWADICAKRGNTP